VDIMHTLNDYGQIHAFDCDQSLFGGTLWNDGG